MVKERQLTRWKLTRIHVSLLGSHPWGSWTESWGGETPEPIVFGND